MWVSLKPRELKAKLTHLTPGRFGLPLKGKFKLPPAIPPAQPSDAVFLNPIHPENIF
jgi:hypothetical protein